MERSKFLSVYDIVEDEELSAMLRRLGNLGPGRGKALSTAQPTLVLGVGSVSAGYRRPAAGGGGGCGGCSLSARL